MIKEQMTTSINRKIFERKPQVYNEHLEKKLNDFFTDNETKEYFRKLYEKHPVFDTLTEKNRLYYQAMKFYPTGLPMEYILPENFRIYYHGIKFCPPNLSSIDERLPIVFLLTRPNLCL
jgi:hypothetical protein